MILRKLKTGSYIAVLIVLVVLTTRFYCYSRQSQRQIRQVRTQLLAQEAERHGAKIAKVVRRSTLEDTAKEAVGEDIVEGITRVAAVESVATASHELTQTMTGYTDTNGNRLVVREPTGRVTVVTETHDKATAEIVLSQSFQYGLVTFKNNGKALAIRVSELSPLDGTVLHENIVDVEQYLVMTKKPQRKWRDRFGWNAGCGAGVVADIDNMVNVYCGIQWGIKF